MVQKNLAKRLKALRAKQKLSQERLAGKAGISRAYLARLEIGRHDSPLSTLTKLAKALKVKVTELLEMSDNSSFLAKAKCREFKPDTIFPPTDRFSVQLFRLMVATDDARHLQKLILIGLEDEKSASDDAERAIFNGEFLHFIRLICGHLYEAGHAFHDLETKFPGRLDSMVANDQAATETLEYLRQEFDQSQTESLQYSFFQPIRMNIGFHIKQEKLKTTYQKHTFAGDLKKGEVTMFGLPGVGRFHITDNLITLIIVDHFGGSLAEAWKKYDKKWEETIFFSQKLAHLVEHLLLHLFQTNPAALLKERDCSIRVSPAVLSSRKQVEKERQQKHPPKPRKSKGSDRATV